MTTKKRKIELTRVNINLPTVLVEKVKDYADELGLPATQAYTFLINMALQQKDAIKFVPDLLKTVSELQKMSDLQSISKKE